jgi:hypothetical protein
MPIGTMNSGEEVSSGMTRNALARFYVLEVRAYEEINLLSVGQMRTLFPGAQVRAIGFPILGNSIVAYHRKED